MKLVEIESPYAGNVERNIEYARACMKDSLQRGEAPIASHLLYTQPGILDDGVAEERELGTQAGKAWGALADLHAFYTDLGISPGMRYALNLCKQNGMPYEMRSLSQWQTSEKFLSKKIDELLKRYTNEPKTAALLKKAEEEANQILKSLQEEKLIPQIDATITVATLGHNGHRLVAEISPNLRQWLDAHGHKKPREPEPTGAVRTKTHGMDMKLQRIEELEKRIKC